MVGAVAFLMSESIYYINHLHDSSHKRYYHADNFENHFQHLKEISSRVFSMKSPPLILKVLICNHTARDEPLTRFGAYNYYSTYFKFQQ